MRVILLNKVIYQIFMLNILPKIYQEGQLTMSQYQQPPPGGGFPVTPQEEPAAGLAIGALVCGILSLFFGFTFILGVLAIIFAAVAKSQGNKSGKATAGLVLGIIGTGLWIGICACWATAIWSFIGWGWWYF